MLMCAVLGLLVAGCSSGKKSARGHGAGGGQSAANDVHISITPASGAKDTAPNRGITVKAAGGKLSSVVARSGSGRIAGKLNADGTSWHSTWALPVSQHYTVTANATGASGQPVTQTSSFATFTPRQTFTTMIIEGYRQTYGVGMPIILYFDRPVTNKAAVERALQVKSSKRIMGAWYWDSRCGTAPECLYFRPRHYWPTHTQVSFTGHLDGVEAAPGVYGHHDLSQSFTIGSSLIVVASTSAHHMTVYKDGRVFARWPISTGRPGDDTPNGTYLTIEKANPVDMVGPGYNIEVPYSVRFTWSGDYLHDAYWSVGEQGFTNVSHGCVNMPPADAIIYYNMAVPGDPVKITGSPRAGVFDNGWTQWFLPWRQYLRGSAVHKAVLAGPHGSSFVHHRPRPVLTTTTTPTTTTPTTGTAPTTSTTPSTTTTVTSGAAPSG
ncbi:MAG TPA: Ig-like domain-containing protein [Solirubrobacteraceae bacterium]|jgi:lipoprotein-anchoring transpeptidase ErfK/SrfK|nr:Ig-like domain-containing protein [Solirubrobacteraceae bacterium]